MHIKLWFLSSQKLSNDCIFRYNLLPSSAGTCDSKTGPYQEKGSFRIGKAAIRTMLELIIQQQHLALEKLDLFQF
jgi:hypothetical protein